MFLGVKSHSGVIWGHRGQILIFTKNALSSFMLLSIFMLFIHLHRICGINRENWGQSGVDVSKPAGYAVCDGNMSSSPFPFFYLSGNTSISHTSRYLILTKLGHSDRYLDHYSCTKNDGVSGHDGVTGVKKVIFTKKHQILQNT